MIVTLKKAAELSRAALAASKATDAKSSVSVSPFSSDDVSDIVRDGRASFDVSLNRALALIEVGYGLRHQIGEANSHAGVDNLLNRVAAVDEKIARITALTNVVETYDTAPSDDMSALKRRVEQARKDVLDAEQRRFGGEKVIKIDLLSPAIKSGYTDTIAALKRERSGLKDELTAINFNTKITISEEAVAVLRAEKLID